MRVRFFLLILLGFITTMARAQSADLMVMGVSPDLYLVHTVAPKENWYSVGRIYNISPKEVAPYNSLTIDNALSIGQQIKVPLTAANFSQNGTRGADEISVPVYHIIQEKEWMFRISTNYNKVPIENLEKWNGISKDQAKTGMKIIIGYLKVKTDQSPLASKGIGTVKTGVPPEKFPSPVVAPGSLAEKVSTPVAASAAPAAPAAAPVMTPTDSIKLVKKNEPVVKLETKEEKQLPPVEEKAVAVSNPVTQPPVVNNTVSAGGAGYFKSLFLGSGKSISGAAGVFKSTSGWQDGKYYILINNVSVGTIVKVNNPTNSKTVYAKVLGQLPEMKESVGLTVRISEAAASELGATAARFSVEVKY